MKRIELSPTSAAPHFIGSWRMAPLTLCDELIDFFECRQESQTQGKFAGGLNPDAKDSTDLAIRPRDLAQADHAPVRQYIDGLFACYRDYLEQWPFLKTIMGQVEVGSFNIQRYQPGGHFLKLHSERTTVGTSNRVLAWMTYLNDVRDGGSTHFAHYNIDVQPAKGTTLIWPAEWTHAHKGNIVQAGNKYIITGWMHFPAPGVGAPAAGDRGP